MNGRKYFLSLFWTVCVIAMKAQSPISFTSDQGLSNTRIRSITEDSRKNVWICTQSGLNRYDGVKMNVYRHQDGMSGTLGHDIVTCVLEVEPGCVLVGMESGVQVYSYDTDKFTDVPLLAEGGDTLSAHIVSMAKLSGGDVYVCTAGYGLYLLCKGDKGKMYLKETKEMQSGSPLLQLFEDKKRRLWMLGADGCIYCRAEGKVHRLARRPGAVDFCQSSSGRVYLAMQNDGLLCYSEKDRSFYRVSSGHESGVIASINPGTDGQVLIATDGGGLRVYDESTGRITQSPIRTYEYNLATSNVKEAIVDSDGNTWVGVYWKGVWVMPDMATGFDYIGRRSVQKNTIGTNCVTAIVGDGRGDLWLAADHCGVYHLKADGSSSVHFKPGVVKTMPSTVVSILVDSEGGVWLGSTWSGVSKMNPETGECTRIGAWVKGGEKIPNAYAMVEDGAGNIWIGTNGDGLYCYRPKTHGLEHYQVREGDEVRYPDRILYNSYITALLVWGDCLYVGMADGMDVFRLTPEGPKRKGRFLPKANVRDLEIGEDGVLWVATSTGLVRFDVKDGSMKSYTAADGLPTNSLCSIERDAGGKVWVGTDDGLACFNPAKETFDNYRIEDGLQGNEFGAKASYAQNGLLYFGGINGLTCFRPSDVGKRDGVNLEKMDLRIVDFYVNGKAVHAGDRSGHYTIIDRWLPLTDEVNLSHHDKSFSVELSTMSFSNSRVTYRYCVNDGEWMALEHGQNRISFVNMEAGTYRIRIKAEAYGESSDVKELTVKVHPVWYLSPLAVMVYCVLFLFICYMVFLQVKEHFKTKRIFEKHRQEEELNEARIQFFMNISHEIRTPMTLILSPLMKLMKQDQDEAHQRSYSLMYQNSQRILRLINQLMDARKIEKGQFRLKYHKVEMVGFVNNLYELFETTARNRGITFCFVHDMERMDVCVDPQNFDKVIMNLLSNAFKFTPDGGDITIELKEVDGNVSGERDFRLSVTDSGVGIPDQEKKRVFERFYSGKWGGDSVGTGIGLNLTKLLVELHEGHIWAENNPKGKGTRFIVQMPQALELLEDISDDKMPRAVYSAPLEAEHVAETVAELPEEKKGGSKHGRILVVEDETAIRRYLHGEFSGEYHVCECSNGQEAWDYIVQNVEKVDLVVSDVMMPVMDGIALCRNIKGSFNTNHIPVILLTAKSDDADRLEGLSIGADAYMSKPFNMDVLRQTAENLLKNKRRLQGKYSVAQQEGKIDKIEWMSPNDQMMERVMKVINENISNPDLGVEFIADKIGISRVHFHRRLKNATGLTPRDFVRNIRLMQAAKLLSRTDTDVTGVSVATGFRSASTFSTCFKAYYGMSPTEYAHKNSKSEDEPENNEGGNVAEDGHEQ